MGSDMNEATTHRFGEALPDTDREYGIATLFWSRDVGFSNDCLLHSTHAPLET